MKARIMFWTGLRPNDIPVRDVLALSDEMEDMIEERRQMMYSAVSEAVADILEEAFDG